MNLAKPIVICILAAGVAGCHPQPKATDFVTDYCKVKLDGMYKAALRKESVEAIVTESADTLTKMGYSLSEYYAGTNNPKETYIRAEVAWITGWKYDLASRADPIASSQLKEYVYQWEQGCRDKTTMIYKHNSGAR